MEAAQNNSAESAHGSGRDNHLERHPLPAHRIMRMNEASMLRDKPQREVKSVTRGMVLITLWIFQSKRNSSDD